MSSSSLPESFGSSPLTDLGIEESEPMVCEDTFENRRLLRIAKLHWTQLMGEDGGPSGLIRVFTEEELTARRDSVYTQRKPLLTDPGNPYSDYLPPDDYPMDADIPWWLKTRLRGWIQQSIDGVPEEKRRAFPVRCEIIRNDGTRCWNWAPSPNKVKRCKAHAGWELEKDAQNAAIARLKMLQAAPAMADTLESLALDRDNPAAVRLKAATEILDRVGVRGGTELDITGEVEITNPSDEVRERLKRLASRVIEEPELPALASEARGSSDVVDGEVVDESPAAD